jgi:glucose-6-phosphate dehydrogenase assembly protein OpcA
LRPSLEDLLGAGAILASMAWDPSPEARAAIAAFRDAAPRLPEVLSECASGRELTEKGWGADVGYASRLNVSPLSRCSQTGHFDRELCVAIFTSVMDTVMSGRSSAEVLQARVVEREAGGCGGDNQARTTLAAAQRRCLAGEHRGANACADQRVPDLA